MSTRQHQLFILQAISPVHYGSGTGVGDIDLPVARDGVTKHPRIPGSGIKGVLRDHFENKLQQQRDTDANDKTNALFGPVNCEHAAALSIGEGRLLALPVRSYFGSFAYLTCPLILARFKAEALRAQLKPFQALPIPNFQADAEHYHAQITQESKLIGGGIKNRALLEEVDLIVEDDRETATQWAKAIGQAFNMPQDEQNLLQTRLAIADDNVLDFLCETALPVDPHIAIDDQTGTVKQGALWFEENVPAETLFFGRLSVDRSFADKPNQRQQPEQLAQFLVDGVPPVLQIGGKATTGKGFVKMIFANPQEL